jgi:mannose-6-phosphate isomerase-like protein (cupin superfamily)
MPKHVVTGVGPDGRSRVVSQDEKILGGAQAAGLKADDSSVREGEHSASLRIAKLCEIEPNPRIARPRKGVVLPVAMPPGTVAWFEMKFDGATLQQRHRTDSIDFHYILSGEVDLMLEAGAVRLSVGDSVVIPGVVHGWQSERGWSSCLFVVGLEPA